MKRRSRSSIDSDEHQEKTSKSRKRKKSCLDLWDVPSDLCCKTELTHKLYEALRSFKDRDNQLLCEFVVRVPNRRSVPDYYKIVSHPIDLIKIQQKLKTDEYFDVQLFLADVRLLIDNAKLFYKPSSVEYKRTEALEMQFLKTLQEICSCESDLGSPKSPKTVSLKLSSLALPEKGPKASSTAILSTTATKKGAVKATRSKAWLDEYMYSGDPIKIFFADVYSYHDSNGEYIAQPFIDLPSRKDYPEYYRVITEPIGLAVIRTQIEAGYYSNLKAIEDDLFLMIKNAQYFNEPQSEIYKMAVILRKFVINRCMELERKFKTVERSLKSKSSSPTPTTAAQRIDTESDNDDLSCSESDDESEGEGKKKLLLRIKRNSISTKQDPIARILKTRYLPSLRKILLAFYRTLTRATDEGGRVISEMFIKRPSAKLYPEYYVVIKSPVDFKEIYGKIKNDVYKNLSEMMSDIELLVNNAITFNEEYSQIHMDALTLKKIAQTALEQLQSKWPLNFADCTKLQSVQKEISATSTLFAVIKNCMDSTGRKIWLSLKEIPPPSREGDTYCGGRKPIGMKGITQKYMSVDELFDDLCYLFECYCEFYQSQNSLYKDAVLLHRVSVTKYKELTNDRKAAYQYPNVPETMRKLLKELMSRLAECKDIDGHALSDFFRSVVVTYNYSESNKSKRVLTFEKLFQWVIDGRYSRLDQLQADILLLFAEARSKESELVDDGVKILLKQYICIRDNIFANILCSPAFDKRTQQHIEEEELCEDIEDMEDIVAKATPMVINERSVKNMHKVGNVTYCPGDFVYLPSREPHLPPQIALIESIWADTHESVWFNGCWFFRPHETFHVASRKFYEQEVFKSDFYSSAQMSSVSGKCYVLFIKDYIKLYPEGFSEEDVYVCESRYIHKQKIFKKIKFWNVQQSHNVHLLPRLTACSLNKVPSIFAYNANKCEEQEEMDISTPNTSICAEEAKIEDDIESTSTDQSLDRSFFKQLKNITTSIISPEENCTYFQQYCIDDKIFKLGDFVFVRSDQEQPFIARIDQMWTDSNDDPWFHGPWFVRVKEVQHVPTRMFYERELFMSNIQDTNPMRSIIRKCAVLYPSDYTKWRPTEICETDVFICESKYDEYEKQIKKMKNLKQYELSSMVLQDEKFYLPNNVFLWKCHSPQLFPNVSSTVSEPPTTVVSTAMVAVPTSFGQVTLSLQQIQSLLSINQAKVGQQHTSDAILAYPCVWEGCQEIFEDSVDLGSHIFRSDHLHAEVDGNYYCYWFQCPRKKEVNGKPFDSLQKITRHVKEVHLLRVYPQKVPVVKIHGSHFHRRGVFMKDLPCDTSTEVQASASTLTHTSNTTPVVTPVNITPIQLNKAVKATLIQPISQDSTNPVLSTVSTVSITPTTNTGLISVPPCGNNTPIHTNVTTGLITSNIYPGIGNTSDISPGFNNIAPLQTVPEITFTTNTATMSSNVFINPPSSQKQVVHSQIYMNYIERMRNSEDTISCMLPPSKTHEHLTKNVSQWIDPAAIPDGLTTDQALYQIYNHMINDAVKISQWLDNVQ